MATCSLPMWLLTSCVALCLVGYATATEVTFPDAKGQTPLTATLYRPAGDGPFPAVVLLHGCSGIGPRHHRWAETLQSWGYVALLVDSLGPREVMETCSALLRVSPAMRVFDAHGAFSYLQNQPYVDAKRIGVIGWSHGGWTVLTALSDMWTDILNLPRDRFRAGVAFYPLCDHGVFLKPLLVLIGEKDDWTRAYRCVDMVEQLQPESEPVTLKVYPGAYHGFDRLPAGRIIYQGHMIERNREAATDAEQRLKRFLAEHLIPVEETKQ